MIARMWSAQTTSERAPAYFEHLESSVLPILKSLDGYAGGMLLKRDCAHDVEIIVVTWWQSLDAIRGFAGNDIERAVVADEAAALLSQFDSRVRHYDVVLKD